MKLRFNIYELTKYISFFCFFASSGFSNLLFLRNGAILSPAAGNAQDLLFPRFLISLGIIFAFYHLSIYRKTYLPYLLLIIGLFLSLFSFDVIEFSALYNLIKITMIFSLTISTPLVSIFNPLFHSSVLSFILGLFLFVLNKCSMVSCPRFFIFYDAFSPFSAIRSAGCSIEPVSYALQLVIALTLYSYISSTLRRKWIILFIILLLFIFTTSTLLVIPCFAYFLSKLYRAISQSKVNRFHLLGFLLIGLFFITILERIFIAIQARFELLPESSFVTNIFDSMKLIGSINDFQSYFINYAPPGFIRLGLSFGLLPLLILIILHLSIILKLIFSRSIIFPDIMLIIFSTWMYYSESPFEPINWMLLSLLFSSTILKMKVNSQYYFSNI